MNNLTVWDSLAVCEDGSKRKATAIFSGPEMVFVARHWITPASPIILHRELKENYGLLVVIMAVADYDNDKDRIYGEVRAHWSAIAALTGYHRTSVHRKLVNLAKTGAIIYDPTSGRNLIGIHIPQKNTKNGDLNFNLGLDYPIRFVTQVEPQRKIFNVVVSTKRTLEFNRADENDQELPSIAEQPAPQPEIKPKRFNELLERQALDPMIVVPKIVEKNNDRCNLHPNHLTILEDLNKKIFEDPKTNKNKKELNFVSDAKTASHQTGAKALPQTDVAGLAQEPKAPVSRSFSPRQVIQRWTIDEFDVDDWNCFDRRGGRLEGIPRGALRTYEIAVASAYEEITGVPFCHADLPHAKNALRISSLSQISSAIKYSVVWPKETPGFYIRKKGFATVLEFIKNTPFLQKKVYKKKPKSAMVKSGFDPELAKKRRDERVSSMDGGT